MPLSNKILAGSINSSHADIKAEVVIADLLDKGFSMNRIVAVLMGAFYRNFSKDLRNASADMVNEILSLQVTRDGFYDLLPEGLFHELVNYSAMDRDQRKIEFRKQKETEKSARKFFLPLDNEFFLHRAKAEHQILKFVRDPFSGFKRLTLEEPSIPEKHYRSFISLIPFAPEIKGDLQMTALALSEILKKTVKAQSSYAEFIFPASGMKIESASNQILGEELICNDRFPESTLCWEFTIHLEDNSDLQDYADPEKGLVNRILDRFFDIFVPFEIVTSVKYHCLAKRPFILHESDELPMSSSAGISQGCYLGFNMTL